MARLSFRRADLLRLIKRAREAPAAHLMLVGDHGVYFMNPSEKPPRTCVYANGCNPNTDENWWMEKSATFGGDDGAEQFPLNEVQEWIDANTGSQISIEITAEQIAFLAPVT